MIEREIYAQVPFYLGGIYINPAKNLIHLASGPCSIQPKLIEVLVCLCAHHGQVVSANKLIEACWPNQYISDNPLHKCIAQLRRVLGETSKNSIFIRTIPKKGYMVVAKVTKVDGLSSVSEPYWSGCAPYPGHRPFEQDEQQFFFGRAQLINELKKWAAPLLIASNETRGDDPIGTFAWLSIYGASGCGKTSLVQAGILPAFINLSRVYRPCCCQFDLSLETEKLAYVNLLTFYMMRKFCRTLTRSLITKLC